MPFAVQEVNERVLRKLFHKWRIHRGEKADARVRAVLGRKHSQVWWYVDSLKAHTGLSRRRLRDSLMHLMVKGEVASKWDDEVYEEVNESNTRLPRRVYKLSSR